MDSAYNVMLPLLKCFKEIKFKKTRFKIEKFCLKLYFHRLIKITDRTLDVVFSRFISISFTINLYK